ncbi:Zn-dependent hydrolase [Bacillus sp. 1P06AnD]|uniref:Zn-dependent hydrolase n=1 Tax=Bacillus sp. 1P06AnD TaxID=3132208 RepID=UPI00399F3C56
MIKCDEERLQRSLKEFSLFGATENGGVTRLSLSAEDIKARNYFSQCCRDLGMDVAVDDMGNIYSVLPGKSDQPPIVFGSHLDSVEKGGKFDGVLGVLSALEVIRTLRDFNVKPEIPLMVVNFTNEEGARFDPAMMSSGVLSGKFDKKKMLESTDKDGLTFKQALKESGYEGSEDHRLKEGTAYLELHIEQGPVLESLDTEIGIVEGVLGMACYEITVTGESDHAGTTPMNMRKDPLFVAAEAITELRRDLSTIDDELVFTMGRMNVSPNIHTVIPNKVVFTLEARHKDPEKIKQVVDRIEALPKEKEGCRISSEKLWGRDTVVFEPSICSRMEAVSREYGYSAHRMYSGAGHDAQFIASYIPSAMIFVPSLNGKSHCEEEYTSFEDCAKGANILLGTVMSLLSASNKREERV